MPTQPHHRQLASILPKQLFSSHPSLTTPTLDVMYCIPVSLCSAAVSLLMKLCFNKPKDVHLLCLLSNDSNIFQEIH